MVSMLLIKSLLLSFVTYIYCSPMYSSAGIFNIGCAKPMHQDLDITQGLRPNSKKYLKFGYIYDIDSPGIDVSTDIPIKHHLKQHNILMPSKVAAILSGISFSELNSKLILTSRISKFNANNLKLGSFDSVNIKFGTFAYDKARNKWHSSLKNGNLRGIAGKISKSNIVHQQNGKDSHFELVLELTPLKNADKVQFLNYAVDSASTDLQVIKWDGMARNGCTNVSSRRDDHFNEIIESSVLL